MSIRRCILGLMMAASSAYAAESAAVHDALTKAQEGLSQRRFSDVVKILRSLPKNELRDCFQCQIALAAAENNQGRSKNAADAASRAVELASTPEQQELAHRAKGSVMLSAAASDPKFLATAEQEFRQAVTIGHDSPVSEYLLGITLLKESRDEEGVKMLNSYLVHPTDADSAANAQRLIAQPRRARERFAPEFEMVTAQGEHISSKDLAGRVVVLDFWATWCPPCRESVPELKELSRKYADKKFTIISVSNDEDQKKWRDFIAKNKMTWPQFYDDGQKISTLFNVHAFPTYLILDGDGAIVKELTGLNPMQSVAARLKDTLSHMKELE